MVSSRWKSIIPRILEREKDGVPGMKSIDKIFYELRVSIDPYLRGVSQRDLYNSGKISGTSTKIRKR